MHDDYIKVDLMMQDDMRPTFLACNGCKTVVAKGKRISAEVTSVGQRVWLMNEGHRYKGL